MPLHQTPEGKFVHGILSISSSTDLPIFYNIPSVIQVASSSGLSFHLTKYCKYSCPLVFLNTLLSNIFSGCNRCAGGSCSFHSICFLSADLSSAPSSSYLYKSFWTSVCYIASLGISPFSSAPKIDLLLQNGLLFCSSLLCLCIWCGCLVAAVYLSHV